ncbi:hypothetical protein WR25_18657 [Diploscapter pachys]|uniref:AAA+ ATPase domain-containing protein n=1 Tax=Diploscapter pachys TaxID=2018661 RepID=A0A2A2LK96_9BILA|nr:hypothetical protein WR25_18657 [Diploscapter pachys]
MISSYRTFFLALLFGILEISDQCLSSGVCGSSYCAAPPSVSCSPSSCQPGYSCGQYDGIFIDSIDSVTTKDGDFHYEKKIRQKSEETSRSREKLPERERNIFGLRRGKFEEVPERTTTSIPDNFTLLELTNPNYIFRECCEQRHLPDACLSKCNFNTFTKDSLQAMYFKTDACPLEAAADMQFCAAQGLDHSPCCARNGVATTLAGNKCLTFCDQRPDRITKLDYSYVPCYDRTMASAALQEIGIFDVIKLPAEKQLPDLPGTASETTEQDDYFKFKKLEKQLQHLQVMEDYIKSETRNLEKELLHAQEEVKRIQSVPLVIGQFLEAVDHDHAIVGSTTGSNYYVRVLSILDRELLKPGCSVALHKYSNALVDVLPPEADSSIQMLRPDEKPDVNYADIGGLDMQKQEVREAVELPLTHGELYQQIGIDPPRGVLMYGPPGCGKTMLAKAVAATTAASFIRVVGSEFVQKYLGEGPRMVRDVFRLAKENSPSIIFIDEIDAIATKRFDAQTGADREVQRILLELLNQMDGFDQTTNVKVIMATNRQDTLDPALLRPGRLDRKIEFPLPDRRQKRLVFSTITAKMNLSDDVDLEDYVARPDKISGADINSICQEAGMHAVRENRYVVLTKDFEKAYKSVIKKDQNEFEFYK